MKKRIFSRFLALVLSALMTVGVLPIAVWAETSDFSYYVSEYTGTGVIDGYYGSDSVVVVPAEIDGVQIKQLAYGVFNGRSDITHVTVSEGIEVLSGHVFGNSSIETVTLPSTLRMISAQCFYYSALTEITIPASVTSIGDGVFDGCGALTDIYVEAEAPGEDWDEAWVDGAYPNIWYAGELTVERCEEGDFVYGAENGEATVWDFTGDYWTDEITVPETLGGLPVVAVGAHAFRDFGYTESIVLPDTVTKIKNYAFGSCGRLTSVNLPLGLTWIGSRAFLYCSALTELLIPESVSYIGYEAFGFCDATLRFEAQEASAEWDSNWASNYANTAYWGACIHRETTVEIKEKTCTEDGYCQTVCDLCGETVSYETYDAGHEYDNGVCELCGDTLPITDLYDYWVEDNGVWIRSYFGGDEHVVIPSEIDGLPVVAIDNYAFQNCSYVLSVEIPETVTHLGYAAFYYCTSLEEMTIPASVETVYNDLFLGCESLQNVYCMSASAMQNWSSAWFTNCRADIWAEGVLVHDCGVLDGFVYRVTDGSATLLAYEGDATVPEIPTEINGCPLTAIGDSAFSDRDDITAVTIPETVTSIGRYAFAWCYSLTEFTVPATVAYIGDYAFNGCSSLQNIYCEASEQPAEWDTAWTENCSANIYFDGVLKQGTFDGFVARFEDGFVSIVDYVGEATEVVIPAEISGLPVTRIEEYAFGDCTQITSVTIPDSVTYIGYASFAWCYSLAEITIPASVTEMSGDVFWDCSSLQNIYCGASAQPEGWVESWASGCDANIYFNGVLTQGVIDGFKIRTENGEVSILDYVGEATEVVIPAEIGGVPVTRIEGYAFGDCTQITSVTIPDSVTFIGYDAFAWCYSLTKITVPASVTEMGSDVFWECTNLQSIYCEASAQPEGWASSWASGCDANIYFNGVLTQGVIDGFKIRTENGEVSILDYVGEATEVVIPSELSGMPVTRIEGSAFRNYDQITAVTIPDSVTFIGYEAFGYCYGLTEITIPASVTEMSDDVFWNCTNLQSIYCEASAQPEGWSSGWASYCNANIYFGGVLTQGVIDGFKIRTQDGCISILGYVGEATELVIPSELEGLPVTRIEGVAFYNCDQITRVTVSDGVTYIGYQAFACCDGLTEITIPASVTEMGSDMFWDSINLQNIYCEASAQPESWDTDWADGCNASVYFDGVLTIGVVDGFKLRAENGCASILGYVGEATEVVIPAEFSGMPVTRIEGSAFRNCKQITSVTIPDSVTFIGYEAFAYCYGLTEITVPASVTEMSDDVFWGCTNLQKISCEASAQPDGWSSGWKSYCDASVYFDGVLTHGIVDGFQIRTENGCVTILGYVGEATELVIPSEIEGLPVTRIEGYAFSNYDQITGVTIPDSVTFIGYHAFAWCDGLTEITIPASVTEMDYDVFYNSENLQNIYCEASERPEGWSYDWASDCDANIYFGGVMMRGVVDGLRIDLDGGYVTVLGYVGEATDVVIPAEISGMPVTAIDNYAFSGCEQITGVTIPDSVTYIGYHAFAYCYSLTEITIPASVDYVGDEVFWGDYSLQNIYCEASEPSYDWSSNWLDGCEANVYFDGVLTVGVVDGFQIRTENGEVSILGYFGEATELVIPAEISGLPVTRIENYAFSDCEQITSVTIPDSVTYIGYEAFARCYGLTEITIPASVTEMNGDVFWYCENLQNIYCEVSERPSEWTEWWNQGCDANIYFNGVLTQGIIDGFKICIENGCVSILDYFGDATDVVIPATLSGMPVTRIEAGAFSNCTQITSIVIPDSVTYLGFGAFAWCYGLTEITIPASVTSTSNDIFWNDYNLQKIYCEASAQPDGWDDNWLNGCEATVYFDGVLSIGVVGDYRIYVENGEVTVLGYLGDAAEIVIPAEIEGMPVTAIGDNAFAYLNAVTSITIPDGVTVIGNRAFAECFSLTELTLPAGVAWIGEYAFSYCHSLAEVTVPASVEWMDYGVFWGGESLQNIYCEASAASVSWNDGWLDGCNACAYFDGVLTRGVTDGFKFLSQDGFVTILDYLGDATEIVIPAEIGGVPVKRIAYRAFADQYEITSVVIPDSVEDIVSYAFAWCYGLTEITIPESVVFMDDEVFYECTGLQAIYCEASEQPEEWNSDWAYGCDANIYFDGVMTTGIIGDYRIDTQDGCVTILKYFGSDAELVIPSEINGMPVTRIGYEAFAYCDTLTEVTIPANVTEMGGDVFWECSNLQNIYCEASAQPSEWSNWWNQGCDANIYFDGVMTQGVIDGFQFRIGGGEVAIMDYVGDATEIVIPAEINGVPVTRINSNTFSYCDQITSVTIPDSVTYIGYEAFAWCYSLTEITIPASVTEMSDDVFWGCDSLQKIDCEASAQPVDWQSGWANGCNATVYFDGVFVRGVVDGLLVSIENGAFTVEEYVGTEETVVIPAQINGIPVTRIEAGAFGGCDHVTGVTIPDTVTNIGNNAFSYCVGLTEITIPASVTEMNFRVFYECDNLQTIYCEAEKQPLSWNQYWASGCAADVYFDGVLARTTTDGFVHEISADGATIVDYVGTDVSNLIIPAQLSGLPVIAIRNEAFSYNRDLITVTVPDSVVYMGEYAFYYCSNLQAVHCEASAQPEGWADEWIVGCDANVYFNDVLAIGAVDGFRVDLRGEGAVILGYYGDEADVVIPAVLGGKPVTEIGFEAFRGAYGIESIVLPEGLKIIGDYAFSECQLTELTVPASVEYIGERAFAWSMNLADIYLAETAVIEDWSEDWYGRNEANIWLGSKLINFWDGDYRVLLTNSGAVILEYIGAEADVIIPATLGGAPVVAIQNQAFAFSETLESIVIPDTVVTIGEWAFMDSYWLETVVLPKNLKTLGEGAFSYCYSLTAIDIPGSVGVINAETFGFCTNLKTVVLGEGIEIIGGTAFAGCAMETIVLPSTLREIGTYAFAESHLVEITVPASVEYLGNGVFMLAESLETVYFEASEAGDWASEWADGCKATFVWGTAPEPEITYGDANGDGKVNGKDATRLLQYLANYNNATGESSVAVELGADANGDGKINGKDATRLLQYLANYNNATGESSVTLGPKK